GLRRMVAARLDLALARRVDASDIVQDTLLVAARRMPEFLRAPHGPFEPWLRRIARDRLHDQLRRHRAAERRALGKEHELPSAAYGDRSTLQVWAQIADRARTPAESVVRRELWVRFAKALESLSDDDREVLVLRHCEQLGNAEAAEALG